FHRVGVYEHRLLRFGVLVPLVERREVDGRELPLLERMPLALEEAAALLLAAHREPELDEVHPAAREVALELGCLTQELRVLLFRAEAHDVFDAGAVVPGTVEQDELTARRQVLHVPLEIPLTLFDGCGFLERDDARAARVEVLHEPLDRAALARGVSTL